MDSALVQELLLHHDSIRSKVHLAVVDPELLPGSGYGIIVQQIQQNNRNLLERGGEPQKAADISHMLEGNRHTQIQKLRHHEETTQRSIYLVQRRLRFRLIYEHIN